MKNSKLKIGVRIKQFFKCVFKKDTEEDLENTLFDIIKEMSKTSIDAAMLDRKVSQIMFNAKYSHKFNSGDINRPSETLQDFFKKASRGNTSFLSEPFYIHLKLNNDKVIKKLKYRLKRGRDSRTG